MNTQDRGKKRQTLVPQYLRQFSCIGPDCEDSCCVGWTVSIDETTFKKYKRVRDPELGTVFEKQIKRVRASRSADNFGKIKMNRDGSCPFLSEEKWCTIQLRLGEEFLSNTCAIYPRISHQVNGVLETSATLSCPEAARLALLPREPMEFDLLEEGAIQRYVISRILNTADPSNAAKPAKYFWELRVFTIQVLQNRTYSLEDRLLWLGLFYRKADELARRGQVDGTPALIGSYLHWMEQGDLHEHLNAIPAQSPIQMKLLKELVDIRFSHGIPNQRYLQCLAECLIGLRYTAEEPVENIAARYEEAYARFYAPFVEQHGYMLENYLVNYVFKNLFPCGGRQSVFDDYVLMILHYALIKMHLIGMAAFHQGLTPDQTIRLIQSFSRTVEHNETYLHRIEGLLKDNGYATLPYMAILIRN
ncbi:lysine-N-methylase [Kyrpidia spormannii]|uniref:Lysine-N-methylase n=1 Tax=Kyrpidia spormannii TaxID=2055160 RepID=A0A2K8N9J0_9BACL|nr:flagellin lysine-N-methylase [Kyrpidia spormannii]ATY86018.1 lysine-N-methylase [Kyrpidia spormannii]